MNYSISNYQTDIRKSIELCEMEIINRKNGISGESTIEQMENTILPELTKLLQNINTGELPPEKDRYLLSFAYAFKVWGWDMQNPTDLFVSLTELNNNYKKL
jgi:hypothetical protein